MLVGQRRLPSSGDGPAQPTTRSTPGTPRQSQFLQKRYPQPRDHACLLGPKYGHDAIGHDKPAIQAGANNGVGVYTRGMRGWSGGSRSPQSRAAHKIFARGAPTAADPDPNQAQSTARKRSAQARAPRESQGSVLTSRRRPGFPRLGCVRTPPPPPLGAMRVVLLARFLLPDKYIGVCEEAVYADEGISSPQACTGKP
ncbi:hypothetical protein N7462_007281 [Penicillium macrosclerotiorum]|uniref:uncharacterized protein n=1 Tax=Penicillium macrosclerotiorum TaxID=303699 RepID=UPI002546FB84|nr:uncharacterized protein N7462_007281 [Penicillium macrosclerotiorum]KAJ5679037.1 hypothetical protein N7462_007281 [Penicillium macrosclerotiorum]